MNCLIIGGTSGLGLSLGRKLKDDYTVTVTGRHDPKETGIRYEHLDLSDSKDLSGRIEKAVETVGAVDLLIHAAGFYQEGTLTEIEPSAIHEMVTVGLEAIALVAREVLVRQESLGGYISITSTSQWNPRLLEPVYAAVKAGQGALANSIALDPRVKKTLVAGPSGIATPFWEGWDKDTSKMLDPDWVADEIIKAYNTGDFSYKFAKILRNPDHVEVAETRD